MYLHTDTDTDTDTDTQKTVHVQVLHVCVKPCINCSLPIVHLAHKDHDTGVDHYQVKESSSQVIVHCLYRERAREREREGWREGREGWRREREGRRVGLTMSKLNCDVATDVTTSLVTSLNSMTSTKV